MALASLTYRNGALPALPRGHGASLASLLGQRPRQRPQEDPDEPLGEILSRSLPKPLAHELADALGIEPEPAPVAVQHKPPARQLSRPVTGLADWLSRIENKSDPDRELILAPDGVRFASEQVMAETRALLQAHELMH